MSPRKKRPVIGGSLYVKPWPVLVQAVEDGVAHGWRRAFKHDSSDEPPDSVRQRVADQITEHVLTEICEAFDFPDGAAT